MLPQPTRCHQWFSQWEPQESPPMWPPERLDPGGIEPPGSQRSGPRRNKIRPGSCWSNGNTCLPAVTWTWERCPSSSTKLSWQTGCPSKSTTSKYPTYVWWYEGPSPGDAGHWCHPWKSHSMGYCTVVLVWKKDGSLRFCIDLGKLNNWTIKDAYLLPHINETLDSLQGSQWFSLLNLKSGYWQVKMDEESKPLTTFTMGPLGFFECE